jgi:hypothetical protein
LPATVLAVVTFRAVAKVSVVARRCAVACVAATTFDPMAFHWIVPPAIAANCMFKP